ncbi:hypothetical protein D046_1503 [Vibrio parahaemolyticus V-223/04]|nr:hypothetical protein D046_1503 [Vibrio parahaemolyticus V-223/04]EWM38436.1 hypothetical protein D043_1599 [Vibrio parahaemolyticus EKP-021]
MSSQLSVSFRHLRFEFKFRFETYYSQTETFKSIYFDPKN